MKKINISDGIIASVFLEASMMERIEERSKYYAMRDADLADGNEDAANAMEALAESITNDIEALGRVLDALRDLDVYDCPITFN